MATVPPCKTTMHLRIFQAPLTTHEEINNLKAVTGDKTVSTEVTCEIEVGTAEEPTFVHHGETTNMQLFFDLFFVANLSSFDEIHEVNSLTSLSSYIQFFCILWCTWCQVTLYDVRFITDSLVERLMHGCHFGVMVALAVVGPTYGRLHTIPWAMFQKLSFMLIVSRSVLICQYGTVLYSTWGCKKARMPLIMTMAALGIAVAVYTGLLGAFYGHTTFQAYYGWYVVFAFEVISSIAIAAHWKMFSFEKTSLIERMTCLSLIVLGEGVIGICAAIIRIERLDNGFSSSAIGTIICTVLIIYLSYILYFDNVPKHPFGSVRQQIWAFLHFPFHLTLVLLTEGASQFVGWRHIIEYIEASPVAIIEAFSEEAYNHDVVWATLNQTVYDILIYGPLASTVPYEKAARCLESLDVLKLANLSQVELSMEVEYIEVSILQTVFDAYGFQPPEIVDDDIKSTSSIILEYYGVFEFLFEYFFISAGLALIGMGLLTWLSIPNGRKGLDRTWRWIGIGSHIVFGSALALLSLMVSTNSALELGITPWTSSIVAFIFLVVFLCDQLVKRHVWTVAHE